jgi:LEA14-like dessication related protein
MSSLQRWFPVIALLLLAFTVAACSKPVPPTVTPREARVTRVEPARLVLSIVLDVNNPNSFAIVAQAVDGTLELESGTVLGRARVPLQTSIPAKSSSQVTSELSVPWANLPALAPFALSGTDVRFRFRGTATIGGDSLNVGVPFELSGVLNRAQVLELGLRGLGVPAAP